MGDRERDIVEAAALTSTIVGADADEVAAAQRGEGLEMLRVRGNSAASDDVPIAAGPVLPPVLPEAMKDRELAIIKAAAAPEVPAQAPLLMGAPSTPRVTNSGASWQP